MKVRSSLPSSLLATLTATLPATLAAALVLGPAQPCGAIDTIQLKIPLLETSFSLRLSELADPTRLFDGTSDFAEINRATGGKLGQQLRKVLNTPLPLPMGHVLRQSVGTPLLEQALLVLSTLGTVHGQPPDLSGRLLQQALETVVAQGHPTVLTLLRAIPGDSVSVDLGGATSVLERLVAQQRLADRLLAKAPAATAPLQGSFPGPLPVRERSAALTQFYSAVRSAQAGPQCAASGTRIWRLADPALPSEALTWPLLGVRALVERDFYPRLLSEGQWLGSLSGPQRRLAVLGQPGSMASRAPMDAMPSCIPPVGRGCR